MRFALAVLAILLICACATARNDHPSLQTAVDSYFISSKSTDTALSESLLANEHIFIGPTGKLQDKPQRVAWLRENSDWLPSVTTRDVVITDLGQIAIVTGIWLIPDGGKIVYERFLHVWQLRDSRWQMISHQVTEMPSP